MVVNRPIDYFGHGIAGHAIAGHAIAGHAIAGHAIAGRQVAGWKVAPRIVRRTNATVMCRTILSHSGVGGRLFLTAVGFLFVFASSLSAQFQFDIREVAQQLAAEVIAAEETGQAPSVPAHLIQPRLGERSFEDWIFADHQDQDNARKQLESEVESRIAMTDRLCQLTDEQRSKLAMAGKGDIVRLWQQIEQARSEFRKVQNGPHSIHDLAFLVQPIQLKMHGGLLGSESLFHKVMARTLTAEQFANYAAQEEERRRFDYRSIVKTAIRSIEQIIPLSADQREKLSEILQATAPPPTAGPNAVNYVLVQAADRADEIDKLLSERQQPMMKQIYEQARRLEPLLRQPGMIHGVLLPQGDFVP